MELAVRALAAGLVWIAGVAIGRALGGPIDLLVPAICALLGGAIAPARSIGLTGMLAGLLFLAVWWSGQVGPRGDSSVLTAWRGQEVELSGEVTEPPRCQRSICTFVLEVRQLVSGELTELINARARITTQVRADLEVGRQLVARGQLRELRTWRGSWGTELLARQGVHESMDFPSVRLGGRTDASLWQRVDDARAGLQTGLVEAIGGPEGSLAAGVLLGKDVPLPTEALNSLRATGTSHILAVSGFNMTLVGAAAFGIARVLLGQRLALIFAVAVVGSYTVLVGAPPSAVRAALMFSLASTALALGRLPDALTALVLSAAAMLAVQPALATDPGFQLSCLSTAGLLLFGGPFTRSLSILPRWLAGGIGLTLAAQLLTVPLTTSVFHTISLVAPLANLAIGWAMPAITFASMLTLVASWLPDLARVPATVSWLLGHYILLVVDWLAALPLSAVRVGAFPPAGVVVSYVLVLTPTGLMFVGRRLRLQRLDRWGILAVLGSSLGLMLVGIVVSQRAPMTSSLRAELFDVGPDALSLIETSSGQRVLIGSFQSSRTTVALAERLPFLDRGLDLVVVTAAGSRYSGGVRNLIDSYPTGLLVAPAGLWSNELAIDDDPPYLPARPGLRLVLDDGLDLTIESLKVQDDYGAVANVRLRHSAVEMLAFGGEADLAQLIGGAQIVRLAPSHRLTRQLFQRLSGASALPKTAFVGGIAVGAVRASEGYFGLADGSTIDLMSDGTSVRLTRRTCDERLNRCEWP